MPNNEFDQRIAQRQSYIRGLDGVEAFLLLLAFMWSLAIIFLPPGKTHDPTCSALQSWLPWFPVRLHGWGLMTVCIFHGFGSRWKWPDLRAACIGLETIFFLYAYFSILLSHEYLVGLWCLPVVILFSSLNFATLLKPRGLPQWELEHRQRGSH